MWFECRFLDIEVVSSNPGISMLRPFFVLFSAL